MQIVERINNLVEKSIYLQKYSKFENYVKSPYLRMLDCEDGILLYNSLTSDIILLTEYEYKNPDVDLYKWMVEHWFYFPEDITPKTVVYMMKHQMDIAFPVQSPHPASRCVIATTTACNARCYYCYEAGVTTKTMTDEMALDVAKYIEKNSKQTRISWFGGEPLCNPSAIRIISKYLKEHGVKFNASIITNGYLLDQFSAEELKNDWNIGNVQITLDGTNDIYLLTKNYKNGDTNAFNKVLDNIEFLLENSIGVSVRLNVSLTNGEDLSNLIDILYERFSNYRKISIYPRELFVGLGDPPLELTDDEYEKVIDNVIHLTDKLISLGMMGKIVNITVPKRTHCMADTGSCSMITPLGDLTPCEHYIDSNICGNIFSNKLDHNLLELWTEPEKETPLCKECPIYPKCVKIKKCPGGWRCNKAEQRLALYRTDAKIRLLYKRYKETMTILNKK